MIEKKSNTPDPRLLFCSWVRGQMMIKEQQLTTHTALYKLGERGRKMRPKYQTEEDKKNMIDYLGSRWMLLPPGEDRNIQLRAMGAVLSGDPLPSILTSYELDRKAEIEIEECRKILRTHKSKIRGGK